MSAAVTLSATFTVGGNALTISKAYTAEFLRKVDFELPAGGVMALTFDSTHEGADFQMLHIRALNNADVTQDTEVSYGVSDADALDPANGTAWRPVNGLHLSWETVTLSATGKLYIYNSGANRANVSVAVGLDGA